MRRTKFLKKCLFPLLVHVQKIDLAMPLLGLGAEEIQDMIDDGWSSRSHCHFCNQKFQYSKEELEEFLKGIKVIF